LLDFTALFQRTGRLAANYRNEGLQWGEPLAVITQRPSVIAWTVYIALFSGCTLLPINPRRAGFLRLIEDCGIVQVIADTEYCALLPPRIRCLSSDGLWRHDGGYLTPNPSPGTVDHIQLIVPTSGTTTGSPRGVMLCGGNLVDAIIASRQRIELDSVDVWLACLPMFHIAGLSIQLRCLQAGAAMLLHDGFDSASVWRDLQQRGVTHISLVPTMLVRLLDQAADAPPPQSLRVVLVGGGPLSSALAKRAILAGWPLYPTYGMSETASQVATLGEIPEEWRSTDVGKPLEGVQVDIVDQSGCKTYGKGRIQISGPTVMVGYSNPEGNSGVGLNDGHFISNDLGRIDTNGHLHVLGRADDVIVSGGENIHPHEVEEQLLCCPGVDEVAVSALPDVLWGQRLVALVVGSVTETDFFCWCQMRLPRFQRPGRVIKVKALIRNSVGKIDRRALREFIDS
jgi:O-succinylbenzoic acid--CoA ligase